jgi:hypothetical protein
VNQVIDLLYTCRCITLTYNCRQGNRVERFMYVGSAILIHTYCLVHGQCVVIFRICMCQWPSPCNVYYNSRVPSSVIYRLRQMCIGLFLHCSNWCWHVGKFTTCNWNTPWYHLVYQRYITEAPPVHCRSREYCL